MLVSNTASHQRMRLLEPRLDENERCNTLDSVNSTVSLGFDDRPKEFAILGDFTVEGVYLDTTHGRIHMIRTTRVFCLPSKALHGTWTQERFPLLVLFQHAFGG